jgi:hypothetical protein
MTNQWFCKRKTMAKTRDTLEYSSTHDQRDVAEESLMVRRQKMVSENTCDKPAVAEHENLPPLFHCQFSNLKAHFMPI